MTTDPKPTPHPVAEGRQSPAAVDPLDRFRKKHVPTPIEAIHSMAVQARVRGLMLDPAMVLAALAATPSQEEGPAGVDLEAELRRLIKLCTSSVLIPADEDGPNRVGYMVGKDDGKTGLDVTPEEAFFSAFPATAARLRAQAPASSPRDPGQKVDADIEALAIEMRRLAWENRPSGDDWKDVGQETRDYWLAQATRLRYLRAPAAAPRDLEADFDLVFEAMQAGHERSIKKQWPMYQAAHKAYQRLRDQLVHPPKGETPSEAADEERRICLGCGDMDATTVSIPNAPGTGDADEGCAKCGSSDFADSPEEAIAWLVKHSNALHAALMDAEGKALDAKINAASAPGTAIEAAAREGLQYAVYKSRELQREAEESHASKSAVLGAARVAVEARLIAEIVENAIKRLGASLSSLPQEPLRDPVFVFRGGYLRGWKDGRANRDPRAEVAFEKWKALHFPEGEPAAGEGGADHG